MNITEQIETLIKRSPGKYAKDVMELRAHILLFYKYAKEEQERYSRSNITSNGRSINQFKIILKKASTLLNGYALIIQEEFTTLSNNSFFYYNLISVESILEHALDLIEINFAGEDVITEGNVFLGIEEKLERANKSAREGNAEGLLSSLHTIVELLFKDKLGIALDMDGARLGKVLKICIEDDIFPEHKSILSQIFGNVCDIDNKMKHTGYNPTPKQMNDALLITTQASRVLRKEKPQLKEDTIDKISALLVKNN
ncbi:hypothetical protein JW711_02265 [Candidatus Woesearchaeota archaeon]|nr:hypothetical protein [Candidatus Woesearchaeota archaeon]